MKTTANFDSGRFDVPGHSRGQPRGTDGLFVAVGFGSLGWFLVLAAGAAAGCGNRQPRRPVWSCPNLPGRFLPDLMRQWNCGLPREISVLPEALGGYVTRVESLLAEYERAAAGKLRIIKSDPQSDAAAKVAAGAAGAHMPFTTEAGEVVYLGLTIGSGADRVVAPLRAGNGKPRWNRT